MTDTGSDRYDELIQVLRRMLRVRTARHADELLQTLSHMHDPLQAATYLGEWLRRLPPEAVVSALDGMLAGAERKTRGADLAVQAMLHPRLRAAWGAHHSRRVQAVARHEGRFDLAAILLELPDTDERFVPGSRLPKDLAEVPLGVRKTWAKLADGYLLERLLADPDRAVISNLLDNPKLTQREVIRLASEKTAGEEVLEAVALHPRWIREYRVKVTLAYNPSTPVRITLAILRLLMSPDLAALSRDGRLSSVVTRRAEQMLKERGAARIMNNPG